ncbi:hypothetical protein D3C83_07620 [compost metagenome]
MAELSVHSRSLRLALPVLRNSIWTTFWFNDAFSAACPLAIGPDAGATKAGIAMDTTVFSELGRISFASATSSTKTR